MESAAAGAGVLSVDDVLPGVPDIVREVKVEAVFDDGTRMVVVRNPFGDGGSLRSDAPGAVIATESESVDAARTRISSSPPTPPRSPSASHRTSTSSRSIRGSGSIRAAAYGMRLAIPAGSALRFEPGVATDRAG